MTLNIGNFIFCIIVTSDTSGGIEFTIFRGDAHLMSAGYKPIHDRC